MAVIIKEEYLNDNTFIKRYAIDEDTGEKYNLVQHPTNIIYSEAIDLASNPNNYSYSVGEKIIDEETTTGDEITIKDEMNEETLSTLSKEELIKLLLNKQN